MIIILVNLPEAFNSLLTTYHLRSYYKKMHSYKLPGDGQNAQPSASITFCKLSVIEEELL